MNSFDQRDGKLFSKWNKRKTTSQVLFHTNVCEHSFEFLLLLEALQLPTGHTERNE